MSNKSGRVSEQPDSLLYLYWIYIFKQYYHNMDIKASRDIIRTFRFNDFHTAQEKSEFLICASIISFLRTSLSELWACEQKPAAKIFLVPMSSLTESLSAASRHTYASRFKNNTMAVFGSMLLLILT